jgi:uncharacterized protein HemX
MTTHQFPSGQVPPDAPQDDDPSLPYQPQRSYRAPANPLVLVIAIVAVLCGGAGLTTALLAHAQLGSQSEQMARESAQMARQSAQLRLLRVEVSKDARQSEVTDLQVGLTKVDANIAQLGGAAKTAHLGLCVDYNFQGTDSNGDTYTYEDVEAPTDQGGVPSCPNGSFVSVVPGG